MISPVLMFCLKLSIALSVLMLCYQLFLSRLTFFTSIRWYFIFGILLSFILSTATFSSSLIPNASINDVTFKFLTVYLSFVNCCFTLFSWSMVDLFLDPRYDLLYCQVRYTIFVIDWTKKASYQTSALRTSNLYFRSKNHPFFFYRLDLYKSDRNVF